MIKKFMKNKKGFTLVELMVVVVIIGILVAIAVPVYNGVQASANASAVKATLRNLESGVTTIMSQNNIARTAVVEADVFATLGFPATGPAGSPKNVTYTIVNGTPTAKAGVAISWPSAGNGDITVGVTLVNGALQ